MLNLQAQGILATINGLIEKKQRIILSMDEVTKAKLHVSLTRKLEEIDKQISDLRAELASIK